MALLTAVLCPALYPFCSTVLLSEYKRDGHSITTLLRFDSVCTEMCGPGPPRNELRYE